MENKNVSQEIQGLKMNKGLAILLKKYSYAHLPIYNILTYIDFPTCKKAWEQKRSE